MKFGSESTKNRPESAEHIPSPVIFTNVRFLRNGVEFQGSATIRRALDGDGWFVGTLLDQQFHAYIQNKTLDRILKGELVTIDLSFDTIDE